MKSINKIKHIKIHIVFIAILILGSCLVAVFSLYQIKQTELQMLSSQLYGQSPVVFVTQHQDDSQIMEQMANIDNKPFTLFYEVDDIKRGYYFQKDHYIPPMKEGRFFEQEDFFNNEKVSVVGQDIDNETIKGIKNEGYTIIGVMGADYQSDIDNLIYFNLDSLIHSNMKSNPFVLVSDKHKDAVFKDLKTKDSNDVSTIQRKKSGTFNFITDESFQSYLTVIALIILAVYSFVMIYFYLYEKDHEIKILWLMGIHYNSFYLVSTRNFILQFTSIYTLISGISFAYFFVETQSMQFISSHVMHLLAGYLITLFFSLTGIVYFYLQNVLKIRREGQL